MIVGSRPETLLRAPVAECRTEEGRQELARLSTPTLVYMLTSSLSLEAWLRRHTTQLEWLAEEEHDLYEAMRLSTRLTNVKVNAARAGSRSERLHAEIVGRQAPGR